MRIVQEREGFGPRHPAGSLSLDRRGPRRCVMEGRAASQSLQVQRAPAETPGASRDGRDGPSSSNRASVFWNGVSFTATPQADSQQSWQNPKKRLEKGLRFERIPPAPQVDLPRDPPVPKRLRRSRKSTSLTSGLDTRTDDSILRPTSGTLSLERASRKPGSDSNSLCSARWTFCPRVRICTRGKWERPGRCRIE